MKTIKLNNGIELPLIGIGTNTFGKVDNLFFADLNYDTKELEYAIRNGYRLIDTAIAYRNEKVIGKAVVESGLARSDFIITTKIPGRDGYIKEHEVRKAIEQSLTNLQTDYIDIVLIHHPWQNLEEILQVYQVLESFVESGQINPITCDNVAEAQISLRLLDPVRMKDRLNEVSMPNWEKCIDESLRKSNLTREDIGFLNILHIKRSGHLAMLKSLNLIEKQAIYLEDYGHIGQIDQILILHLAVQSGQIKPGTVISTIAAGIGYVWAANVIKWG